MNSVQGTKILVTGGAGFVGSTTADQLLDAGALEVRVLDNFIRGNLRNLESAKKKGNVVIIEGDIRDANTVDSAVEGVDYVFHQAALRITRCAEAPREAIQVLIDGTSNVLESAVRHKVKKIVAASSASVYGDPSYLPMDENHPFNNRTLYGAGKIANEQMLRAYYEMFKLPYVAFRYFNIYGPRMDIDGVYTEVLIRWMDAIDAGQSPKIFGDGSQSMDFVYVEDVARANVAGLVADVTDEIFNVGMGIQTTLNELCHLLLKVTGSHLKPEYHEARKVNNVQARRATTQKAEKMLGFRAHVDLETGLKSLIQWRGQNKLELATVAGGCKMSVLFSPATAMIPVARPYIGAEEEQAVIDVLRSGWVTQGPRVAEFEEKFSEYIGCDYSVAVSSCTTALHLALLASGIGPGDEVICPSLSFIATANSIAYAGATPIFGDIDLATYNLDPGRLEEAISPRTKAILIVHQIGLPAEMNELLAVAVKHGLSVIEDAACAIGSEYDGKLIGKPLGTMACFSFHPRKILTTGEGGMITTSDAKIAERLRRLRQHAMSLSDVVRHNAKQISSETYDEVGFNFRMTDMQAAIGITQLGRLGDFLKHRRYLAERYTRALQNLPWLQTPVVPPNCCHNYQSYMVRLLGDFAAKRDAIMQELLQKKICTRRAIMATHRELPYRSERWDHGLAQTNLATDAGLILPLFHQMTESDQDYIIEALQAFRS